MTRDMSHVTKCDKIINKLISQLKLNRIQQNFKFSSNSTEFNETLILTYQTIKLSEQNIYDMLHDT